MGNSFKKGRKIKKKLTAGFAAFFVVIFGTACTPFASAESAPNSKGTEQVSTIHITANDTLFTAVFYDTPAAKNLISKMPFTITMSDLNRNEKFYHLDEPLPSPTRERPARIKAGEIMGWSENTLVLFYKTFSNSYGGYTRLGYIENPEKLDSALGSGDARVTFTLP